jgi:hypothetical protein
MVGFFSVSLSRQRYNSRPVLVLFSYCSCTNKEIVSHGWPSGNFLCLFRSIYVGYFQSGHIKEMSFLLSIDYSMSIVAPLGKFWFPAVVPNSFGTWTFEQLEIIHVDLS